MYIIQYIVSSVQYIVYTLVHITIGKLYSVETAADTEHSTLVQLKYLYHIGTSCYRVSLCQDLVTRAHVSEFKRKSYKKVTTISPKKK